MRAPKLTLAERNELRSICILTIVDHRVFINGAWPAYDFLAPNGEEIGLSQTVIGLSGSAYFVGSFQAHS